MPRIPTLFSIVFLAALTQSATGLAQSPPADPDRAERKARTDSMKAMDIGLEKARIGQIEVAITQMREALHIDAKNHAAWYALADIYTDQRRYEEALEPARRAVEMLADEPMYHLIYGIALFRTDALTNARTHLERAIELEPRLFRAHLTLGRIYEADDRSMDAAKAFTRACQLAPGHGDAYTHLAKLYLLWDKLAESRAVLETGLRYVADSGQRVDLYYYLGLVRQTQRQFEPAIAAYTEALKLEPDALDIYFQRAVAYAEQGTDKQAAMADLKRVLDNKHNITSHMTTEANKLYMQLLVR